MSVRSGILAVLTLAPAYGLQLHAEIEARTARVGRINVGQIYSTLTRLVDAGLVTPVPRSDDSLPLYELTDAGRSEAVAWRGVVCAAEPSWAEMVEQVLLVASLPGIELTPLLEGYRSVWSDLAARGGAAEEGDAGVSNPASVAGGAASAAASADRLLAAAALAWIDEVAAAHDAGRLAGTPLSSTRPRRGRKPLLRS